MWKELQIRRYLWEVSRELPVRRKQKKNILSRVESSVREFASEQPNADYAAVVKWFGTPGKIAESYVTEMSAADIVHHLHIRKKLFHCIVIFSLVIVFLWLGVVSIAMKNHYNRIGGYYLEEIEVIEHKMEE